MTLLLENALISLMLLHPQYPVPPMDSLSPVRIILMQRPPLLKYELRENRLVSVGIQFKEEQGGAAKLDFPGFKFDARVLRGEDFTRFDSASVRLWFLSVPGGVEGEAEAHGWRRNGLLIHGERLRGEIFDLRTGGIFIDFSVRFFDYHASDSTGSDRVSRIGVASEMIVPVNKHLINVFLTEFNYGFQTSTPVINFTYTLRGIVKNRFLFAPGIEFNRLYDKADVRPQLELQYSATRTFFTRLQLGFYAGLPHLGFYDFVLPDFSSMTQFEKFRFADVTFDIKPRKELTIQLNIRHEEGEGRIFLTGDSVPRLYSAPNYTLTTPTMKLKVDVPHLRASVEAVYNMAGDSVFYVPQYEGTAELAFFIRRVRLKIKGKYTGPTSFTGKTVRSPFYTLDSSFSIDLPFNFRLELFGQNLTDTRYIHYGSFIDAGRKYGVQLLWINESI